MLLVLIPRKATTGTQDYDTTGTQDYDNCFGLVCSFLAAVVLVIVVPRVVAIANVAAAVVLGVGAVVATV